ncbi:MAG: glycosyltransferase [Bryobacter sp.]|nr:glycosyltransferase [Bryobacter sp.]
MTQLVDWWGWLVLAGAGVAALYQAIAIVAALRQLAKKPMDVSNFRGPWPGVSILKPVRGLDPDFLEAIRSYAAQQYPGEFELLFGAKDPQDPARSAVEQLRQEFPHLNIRWIPSGRRAPNAKVAVLEDLAEEARYPLWLMSDSDIWTPAGYLRQVVAPLLEGNQGLVTTLYRARGSSWPARWEALGIAIDFAPSVLVAPLVGVKEFGLGATIVFRAKDLRKLGGFAAVRDYLADDYQLAKKLSSLGKPAYLSEVVVETSVGDNSWSGVWKHQVRWARTIRVSRGGGYLGLPITHAGLWALLCALAGFWPMAGGLSALRMLTAFVGGGLVLHSPLAYRGFWLAPIWDLWAFAVWIAGIMGTTVIWREGVLRLTKDGKVVGVTQEEK